MAKLIVSGFSSSFQLIYLDPPFYSNQEYKINFKTLDRHTTKATTSKSPENSLEFGDDFYGDGSCSMNTDGAHMFASNSSDIVDTIDIHDSNRNWQLSDHSNQQASDHRNQQLSDQMAFSDKWPGGLYQYLALMTATVTLSKELLKRDGLIWVHCDWHANHFIRLILDEIMGPGRFVNEVIWQYKTGGSSKHHFARKHDNLLVYGKSPCHKFHPLQEKSYNREGKPYGFKGVKEFQDELGWYTIVNMKDVWDIPAVGRTSKQRTGYATQKPEALMERIILSSSNEGDLCGDFFCGSGSFTEVAISNNRKVVAIDENNMAVELTAVRASKAGAKLTICQPVEEDHSNSLHCNFSDGTVGEASNKSGDFRMSSAHVEFYGKKSVARVWLTKSAGEYHQVIDRIDNQKGQFQLDFEVNGEQSQQLPALATNGKWELALRASDKWGKTTFTFSDIFV